MNKKPFSKAILVGEIVDKKVDRTDPFTLSDGRVIPSRPYLEFNVKTSDTSRTRCRVMNSDSQPTRVTDLDRYLKDGDYIKVSGSIDYRTAKNDASKVYITVRPYTIDKVDQNSNEARALFVIQGEVRNKQEDVVDGIPVLTMDILVVNEFNNKVYESIYPVIARGELSGEIYVQVDDGFEVLVTGHIVDALLRDEYDFIIGKKTELELKELREVYDGNSGMPAQSDDDVPF
jgi:hypothetical protein